MDNDRKYKVKRQYRTEGVLGKTYAGIKEVLGKKFYREMNRTL